MKVNIKFIDGDYLTLERVSKVHVEESADVLYDYKDVYCIHHGDGKMKVPMKLVKYIDERND